jgi:hypothetical protein
MMDESREQALENQDSSFGGAASPLSGDDLKPVDEADGEIVIHDADAEDAIEAALAGSETQDQATSGADDAARPEAPSVRTMAEMMSVIEALIFVSEEPISAKSLAALLEEDRGWVELAVGELAAEFNGRNGGLQLREVAGGWQFATRPEHHEYVRVYLKSRPSAKLSLASLETLAVIA